MIIDARQTAPAEHAELVDEPRTLIEESPRALRLVDQLGLWGNLGVSLLGFTGAIFLLVPIAEPGMSLGAAVIALLVGDDPPADEPASTHAGTEGESDAAPVQARGAERPLAEGEGVRVVEEDDPVRVPV